jgi:hypothetical protein
MTYIGQRPVKFPPLNDLSSLTFQARSSDLLKWDKEIEVLQQLKQRAQKTVIRLDLGLESCFFSDNDLVFSGYTLALDELIKQVLNPFKEQVEALILYQGSVCLENSVELSLAPQEFVDKSLLDLYSESIKKRLAGAAILGSIFHRLVSLLDDELVPLAIFTDAACLSPLDLGILFSKERFDHISIAVDNPHFQYTTLDLSPGLSNLGYFSNQAPLLPKITQGLILPSDVQMNPDVYERLSQMMIKLKTPYRLICEKILNDSWDQIDQLIYPQGALHPMSLRMIKGFEASGGDVLFF